MLVARPLHEVNDTLVKGICGQVPGSIIPGMMGMEAASRPLAMLMPGLKTSWHGLSNVLSQTSLLDTETIEKIIAEAGERLIPELSRQAAQLPVEEEDELALTAEGRRTRMRTNCWKVRSAAAPGYRCATPVRAGGGHLLGAKAMRIVL
jgi:L-ribulokinase